MVRGPVVVLRCASGVGGLVATLGLLATAAAADESWPRWYWGVRLGAAITVDTDATSDVKTSRSDQVTGMSVGVDLGRHLSLEVAADVFETALQHGPLDRTIGELGVLTVIPQARLRYPLPGRRVTAYALLGVGVSQAEFNDRKKGGFGLPVDANSTSVVGAVGAGAEYFLADGIAIGAELRYLVSRGHEIAIAGARDDVMLDTVLAAVTLRVGGPTARAEASEREATPGGRYYLTLRFGGATPLRTRIARDVHADPENAAIAGVLDHVFGVGVGLDLGPVLGVELTADGFEPILSAPGVGAVGEYAVYTVVPQIRVRAPLLGPRFLGYALAGAGVSYAEFNDRKPRGFVTGISGTDFGFAVAGGVGAEYFVTDRVAFGLEAKYQAIRGHELTIAGDARSVTLDVVLATLGARIYLGPTR